MKSMRIVAAMIAVSLGCIAGASTAWGQAVPGEPIDAPINVSAIVQGSFGAASVLAENETTQTDFFLLNNSLSINWLVNPKWTVSLSGGYSQFLTRTGGINDQYEGRFQDTTLSASMFPLYVERNTGIIFLTGGGLTFPTSDLSQTQGLYTSANASLTAIKPVGGMILVYSFGFTKNFHRYTSATVDGDEVDAIVREGGAEDLDANRVAVDGVLPSFAISNFFLIIYNVLPKLQLRASLAYSDSWTYDNGTITEEDEFTNENAVAGRGHRQVVNGGFGARYLIMGDSFFGRSLSARLQFTTVGQPLTDDNSGIRFPFWDFENGQASRTTVTLGFAGTY
ncbi:MAG: hypothetical protein AAFS10_25895 [Myxococcota bacterium]